MYQNMIKITLFMIEVSACSLITTVSLFQWVTKYFMSASPLHYPWFSQTSILIWKYFYHNVNIIWVQKLVKKISWRLKIYGFQSLKFLRDDPQSSNISSDSLLYFQKFQNVASLSHPLGWTDNLVSLLSEDVKSPYFLSSYSTSHLNLVWFYYISVKIVILLKSKVNYFWSYALDLISFCVPGDVRQKEPLLSCFSIYLGSPLQSECKQGQFFHPLPPCHNSHSFPSVSISITDLSLQSSLSLFSSTLTYSSPCTRSLRIPKSPQKVSHKFKGFIVLCVW